MVLSIVSNLKVKQPLPVKDILFSSLYCKICWFYSIQGILYKHDNPFIVLSTHGLV